MKTKGPFPLLIALAATWFSVAVLAADKPQPSVSPQKSSTKQKPLSSPAVSPTTKNVADSKRQSALMEELRSSLRKCRAQYGADMKLAESRYQLKLSYKRLASNMALGEYDRVRASQEVTEEMAAQGWEHEKCRDNAKDSMKLIARELLNGMPNEALKERGKEMLALWLAAVEAVDQKNFDQQLSKFDEVRNRIELDLAIS